MTEPTAEARLVVVAAQARPDETGEPLGLRHAARAGDGPRVLCGVDVAGWRVFDDVTFDGQHAAACRRCVRAHAQTTAVP